MKNVANAHRFMVLATLALPIVISGCRSGAWNPSSMFAWNRQPKAETLGGPETVEVPMGPANKYTPNAIASLGAKSPSSPAATQPDASAYGYTADSAATTVADPKQGLAAKANGFQNALSGSATSGSKPGYQTGPYQLNSPTPQTTAATATPSSSLPNPYGGTYKGQGQAQSSGSLAAQTPSIPVPTGVSESLSQMKSDVAASQASATNGMARAAQGLTVPSFPATGSTSTKAQLPSYAAPSQTNGLPTPSAVPTAPSLSTPNAGAGSSSLPSYPPPSAYPSAQATGSSAVGTDGASSTQTPSAGTTGQGLTPTFAPGTTGRNTQYDFSNSGTGS